jgi:transcription-repair coupling factor (superfamily II helicase)
MYMKLLEDAVRELKGEDLEDDVRAAVSLRVDLRIDESYVSDTNQRLMLYRKVAAARREEDIDRVLEEAADRYGPPPESLLNLADYGRLRVMADRLGVESIDREGRTVLVKFRPQTNVDPVQLVALVRQRSDLTLVPPSALRLSLEHPTTPSRASAPAPPSARLRVGAGRSPVASRSQPASSWWTTRARAGGVAPGFTKEEILRPAKDDPRASGGLFDRVGELLSDLLDRG